MLNGNLALPMIIIGFIIYAGNSGALGKLLTALGLKRGE